MKRYTKLAILYLDKVLCGLFLLCALYSVAGSVTQWSVMPSSVEAVKEAVVLSRRVTPEVPELPDYKYESRFKRGQLWGAKDVELSKNPFYVVVGLGESESVVEYTSAKGAHKHVFDVIEKKGVAGCIFPGCSCEKEIERGYIGACGNLMTGDVSVTSVSLKWLKPKASSVKGASVDYCQIQRRLVKKDQGPDEGFGFLPNSEKPQKIFAQALAGKVEIKEEEEVVFVLPGEEVKKIAPKPKVRKEPKLFVFLDTSLDEGTGYEYRVRSVGESLDPPGKEVLGVWSKPLLVISKDYKDIRFVTYSSFRNRQGKLVESVKLEVSVSFAPPWDPRNKYFIKYTQRGVVPGQSKRSAVGRMVRSYKISDANGVPVLKDNVKDKYVWVGLENYTKESLLKLKQSPSRRYSFARMDIDFSKNWIADRFLQRVSVQTREDSRIDSKTGQMVKVIKEIKQYRGFLILVNKNDRSKSMEVELERKAFNKPIVDDEK